MNTEQLRTQFASIGARWTRLSLLYGAAIVVVLAVAGLIALFALDRLFSLPSAVRVTLFVAYLGFLLVQIHRRIGYPLRRRPSVRDVACAIERRHPRFDGRLLSVLELEGAAVEEKRNVSVALVDELRSEVSRLATEIRLDEIFEFQPLKKVSAAAVGTALLVIVAASARPDLVRIFGNRLIGGEARWPQATMLAISFPEHGTHFVVEEESGRPVRIKIARGASLPVTVTVQGENPDSVVLETTDGKQGDLSLASTAPGEWTSRFRSVREPFTFRPVGGDDDGAGRDIDVAVFAPPALANIATELTFPRYTGLDPRREPRGDVEAPIGSTVSVEVTTLEPVARGSLTFDSNLPALELAPTVEGGGKVWRATFSLTQSCAYSVDLVGDTGFRNLEPPTYSVLAVKDRSPTLRVLEPARGDVDVTPAGVVVLRIAADDDYGIRELFAEFKPFGTEATTRLDIGLPAVTSQPTPTDVRRRSGVESFDLRGRTFARDDGPRELSVGESLIYRIVARDNHALGDEPQPNETAFADRRIDVVSPSEKLRLLGERQVRSKDEVKALRATQQEKLDRLEAILKEFDGSEGDDAPSADDIAAIEIGQNQITTRTLKQCREFADIFQEYLFNRLDTGAGAEGLIAIVLDRKRTSTAIDAFDVKLWRPLVEAHSAGTYGRLDLLGRIFEMLRCSLDVGEIHSIEAAKSLSDARIAISDAERPAALRRALEAQKKVLDRLDELLAKLDEWEDFQEIVSIFRNLIEDQSDLHRQTMRALNPDAGKDGGK